MGLRGPKPRRRGIVWSPEFAYAVGLMTADGNLSPDGRHLVFVSKDKEQIERIKTCLTITANASYAPSSGIQGNTEKYYRLQWGDITLYNFFLSIGLMPNKSLRLGPLAIPDHYFFDFLRGTFDGDGCFYSYFDPRWKNSFMFYLDFVSGSEPHITWLQRTIERLVNVRGHTTRAKKGNFFHLKYAKKESLEVMRAMYQNSEGWFLARKRLKIDQALRIVGLTLLGNEPSK